VGKEPVEVFGWQMEGTTGVDMLFAGQMRFPGGILAQMDSGFRTPLRREMEVSGTEANLLIREPFKPGSEETLLLQREGGVEEVRIQGDNLYLGEVEDIENAILNGAPPRVSLADSRGNTATILALIESANTGRPVRIH
jgi:predicted dehydrogenase